MFRENDKIKLIDGGVIDLKDFFCNFYPVLSSFAYKFIPEKEVCKDIVQDVFVSFWEKKKTFQNMLTVKGYFYSSVRNSCLDYLKHSKVEERYREYRKVLGEMSESFMDEIVIAEAYGKVYEEINKLPEMGKKVLLLSLRDKSNKEIAEILNIAINTVKTHKSRAYKTLRENLKDLFLLILPFIKKD